MKADFAHYAWRLQAKKITISVADFLKNFGWLYQFVCLQRPVVCARQHYAKKSNILPIKKFNQVMTRLRWIGRLPLALCLQLLGGNSSLGIRFIRLCQCFYVFASVTQNFIIAGDINKKQQDPL